MKIIGICGQAGSGKDTTADQSVASHGYVKVALADEIKRIAMRLYGFTADQLWGPSAERNKPDMRYVLPPSAEDQALIDALHKKREEPVTIGGAIDMHMDYPPTRFLTPRHALQIIGTEVGRRCYENTWVDLTLRAAHILHSNQGEIYYAPALGLLDGAPQADESPYYRPRTIKAPGGVVIPDVRFQNEIDAIRKAGGYLIRIRREGAELGGAAGQHVSETEQQQIPDTAFDAVLHNTGTILALHRQMDQVIEVYRERVRQGIYKTLVAEKRAADPLLGAGARSRPTSPAGMDDIPPFKRRP